MRPRLVDLFCKAGGAGMGYYCAGFDVVGVDIEEQPNYPFEFVRMDALEFIREQGHEFDAIHASPPCQAYSTMGQRYAERQSDHPDLIAPTRRAIMECGPPPYVIENVMGARREMLNPYRLCGSSFGLGVQRHRLFETNFPMMVPPCAHTSAGVPVYGKLDGRRLWTRADGSELRAPRELSDGAIAMGIDWMEWGELTQAIPPAYTQHIGEYLMHAVLAEAA
jgi:DNA (cytosine-5)-methyltransferase 1